MLRLTEHAQLRLIERKLSLVSLCFHRFDETSKVQYLGVVRCMVNDSTAVVRYSEWVMDAPDTLELAPGALMRKGAVQKSCSPGSW